MRSLSQETASTPTRSAASHVRRSSTRPLSVRLGLQGFLCPLLLLVFSQLVGCVSPLLAAERAVHLERVKREELRHLRVEPQDQAKSSPSPLSMDLALDIEAALSTSGSNEPELVADRRNIPATSQKLAPSKLSSARNVQLGLLFGSRFTQSVTRMAIGPLLVSIAEEMGCEPHERGALLSAYSLGYLLTQIGGGKLAESLGSDRVLLLSTVAGAICTALSGNARSVRALWWAQVLLGASQGPLFPVSMAHLSKWLPPEERSSASTALDTGITAGSLVALPCSGALASLLGWRSTFKLYAALSAAFAVAWALLAAPSPNKCAYISEAERAYLAQALTQHTGTSKGKLPLKRLSISKMLSLPAIWAIFCSHMAFNFGVYFLTSWGPTYYKDSLGVRPEDASFAFFLPPALNFATKLLLNKPLERYMRASRHMTTLQCRRAFTVLGFGGSGLAMLLVIPAQSIFGAGGSTACWALTSAFAALHPAGFKANYMDIARTSSGVVSGLGNTFASLSSYVGPLLVAWLLRAFPSWLPVFATIASVNLAAATVFASFSTTTPVD
uniref:Major facilitator superfamily (MFS) profile domain-containing protein n=2 Tax=Chrysotila carterae TaxID=13221 RepID=A0A7S4F481_CHRCT